MRADGGSQSRGRNTEAGRRCPSRPLTGAPEVCLWRGVAGIGPHAASVGHRIRLRTAADAPPSDIDSNASRWWVSVPGTQHGSRPTLSVAAFDGRTRGVPLARRRRHRPTRSLRGTPHTAADSGRRTAERH
ncbi:MAG: hypothetical protein WDW38_007712 [Sanguina aurantia]